MHSLIHFLTAATISAFGVGFDLTASYGSAAVSFCNGTTITLPPIPASKSYTIVLRHLSLDSSQHPSPPYKTISESRNDTPRQNMRKLRKAIGFPASVYVEELAKMLLALRAAVEEKVGPITSAGVTTMNLVALYEEDLRDAFEYVSLKYIAFPVGWVGQVFTKLALHPKACMREQYAMCDEVVMAVLYTDTALSVSLSVIRPAYALWEPEYWYLADFDLGYNTYVEVESPEEYWSAVWLKIQQIMIENPGYTPPSKVLLMGDRTDEREFREILVRVLWEQMGELPEILSEGAVGVAAREWLRWRRGRYVKPDMILGHTDRDWIEYL
ncbi:hypothetical protein JMJ35_000876 [Cladonia borealis]|uniref:Uncharacterized protein n=1 Tax=Cladonia borealis TaxID=184061 RepID=A0AA39R7I1_9LECA|nr:hypothetical protein JMJ35_000876 [Cladonia borealis]